MNENNKTVHPKSLNCYISGHRSWLALLVIIYISLTCSGAQYEVTFFGPVVDAETQEPLDAVIVFISEFEIPEDFSEEDNSYNEIEVQASDSTGRWETIITMHGDPGCGSDISGPASVELFYFRLIKDGYITIDTTFLGEELAQNRVKDNVFSLPQISLTLDIVR